MNHGAPHGSALPRVLVTGFEPFGGRSENVSQAVLQALPDQLSWAALEKCILPVSFASITDEVPRLIEATRPVCCIGLGEAAERDRLSLERVALNFVDATIPDNDGARPIETSVREGGPGAYFSRLPLRTMLRAAEAFVPSEVSLSAGAFVCNALLYTLCELEHAMPPMQVGFIHIPTQPALSPERWAQGIHAALEALRPSGSC